MPGKAKQPQDEEAVRRAVFTHRMIDALKQLEQSQVDPNPGVLAARALEKLQYDLPLLTVKEVDALSDVLRSSCTSTKGANLPQGITRQLISNVTSAVVVSSKPSAGRPNPAVQEPPPPAPTASISLLEVAHTSHLALAAAYQRLSAVLLLQLTNTTLTLPIQDAWHMLHTYDLPETPGNSDPATSSHDQPAQWPDLKHMSGDTAQSAPATAAPTATYIDVDATELDDDDTCYEPLEPAQHSQPPPPKLPAITASTPAWKQAPGLQGALNGFLGASAPESNGIDCPDAQESWTHVRSRLLDMCSPQHLAALTVPRLQLQQSPAGTTRQASTDDAANAIKSQGTANGENKPGVHPSKGRMVLGQPASAAAPQQQQLQQPQQQQGVSGEAVHLWQDAEVQQGLLQVLRSLGVHPHASELQPVLHAYIMVVLDWLEQHTSCVEPLLQQVWEALGAQQIAGLPRQQASRARRSGGGVQADQGPVLLAEADLVLTMVLHLNKKLSSESAGRAALWRQVHSQLLPVLQRCLADVSAAGQQNTRAGDALDKTVAVVLLYLELRPGGFNLAQHLQSSGILRGLCALFPAWAAHPEAETLRQAVLLCSATSPDLLTWVLAVPGVKALVTGGEVFSKAGAAYAHGVVWRVLMSSQARSATPTAGQQKAGTAAAGVAPEAAGAELEQVLDLGLASSDVEQVGCMHECLQLMVRVWRVCDGRVHWGPTVQASMRRALSGLKQQQATHSVTADPATTTPAVITHATATTDNSPPQGLSSCTGDGVVVAGVGAGAACEDDKPGDGSLVQFEVLQVRHWKISAASALKEMLTEGAKKD